MPDTTGGAYNDLLTKISGLFYDILGSKIVESWRAAEDIDYGVPVFSYEGEDYAQGGGSVWNVKQDGSTITLDADLITDNTITTTITIDGVAQTPVATPFDTDHDTTMDNHLAALEAAITGLDVTLTDGTNNRQFTLFLKGYNLSTVASVVTGGASQAGVTIAYTTNQIFIGFSAFTQKSHVDSVGYYVEDEAINVLTYGQVYGNSSVAVNANTNAYVVWAYGSTQGKLTNVATDNYDIKCKFRETVTAADIVLVEIRGQQIDATP